MNGAVHISLVRKASEHTVVFARSMVSDSLPAEVRYRVRSERGVLQPEVLTEAEVVDLVWSEDGVLRWVDFSVCNADENFTYIGMDLARDRVAEEQATVYFARGMGPFGVKSPVHPIDWKSVEMSGKFKIRK